MCFPVIDNTYVWLPAFSLLQKKNIPRPLVGPVTWNIYSSHSSAPGPPKMFSWIHGLGQQSQLLLETSSHCRSSFSSVRYRWKCGVVFQWRGGGTFSDRTDSNRTLVPFMAVNKSSLHKLICDVGVGTLIKVIHKSTPLKLSHREHYCLWVFD